jgi:hypothetical protein
MGLLEQVGQRPSSFFASHDSRNVIIQSLQLLQDQPSVFALSINGVPLVHAPLDQNWGLRHIEADRTLHVGTSCEVGQDALSECVLLNDHLI